MPVGLGKIYSNVLFHLLSPAAHLCCPVPMNNRRPTNNRHSLFFCEDPVLRTTSFVHYMCCAYHPCAPNPGHHIRCAQSTTATEAAAAFFICLFSPLLEVFYRNVVEVVRDSAAPTPLWVWALINPPCATTHAFTRGKYPWCPQSGLRVYYVRIPQDGSTG